MGDQSLNVLAPFILTSIAVALAYIPTKSGIGCLLHHIKILKHTRGQKSIDIYKNSIQTKQLTSHRKLYRPEENGATYSGL